jgi:hypothetical protein
MYNIKSELNDDCILSACPTVYIPVAEQPLPGQAVQMALPGCKPDVYFLKKRTEIAFTKVWITEKHLKENKRRHEHNGKEESTGVETKK